MLCIIISTLLLHKLMHTVNSIMIIIVKIKEYKKIFLERESFVNTIIKKLKISSNYSDNLLK